MTKQISDEIMGLKEELRENYTDAEINTAIEEATKTIAGEGAPAAIQRLEQEIRSLLAEPKVETPAEEPPALPRREKEVLKFAYLFPLYDLPVHSEIATLN